MGAWPLGRRELGDSGRRVGSRSLEERQVGSGPLEEPASGQEVGGGSLRSRWSLGPWTLGELTLNRTDSVIASRDTVPRLRPLNQPLP